MPCGGTYFVTTLIDNLGFEGDDLSFCQTITEQAGVAAIPLSPFYGADPARNLVRFCFSKTEDVLEEAIHRLGRFF
jgi:aspartate/methionine/tyrosine aminotransferase